MLYSPFQKQIVYDRRTQRRQASEPPLGPHACFPARSHPLEICFRKYNLVGHKCQWLRPQNTDSCTIRFAEAFHTADLRVLANGSYSPARMGRLAKSRERSITRWVLTSTFGPAGSVFATPDPHPLPRGWYRCWPAPFMFQDRPQRFLAVSAALERKSAASSAQLRLLE